jgi:hypothetical protein
MKPRLPPREETCPGKGEVFVVLHQIADGAGDRVAFTDGREAGDAFYPHDGGVDADLVCCSTADLLGVSG